MKTPAGRRTNKYFVASFGFLVIAALVVLPSVQSRRLERTSIANPSHNSSEVSKVTSSLGRGNWMPNVAAPVGGETIEIFAADCTTAKTAFALGETICAKTNGVDLTVPGNYYVNWFHANSTETNGGTITQNPQYFLFSLPTGSGEAGTWKVNIGRVTPAESSIIGNPPLFTVSPAQTIDTFAYDTLLQTCTNTPKTSFVLGETVCARTVGVDPAFNRRFAWVDPSGITREFAPITSDPATDSYQLPPLTETSSAGTWKANVVSSRGTTVLGVPFTVSAATARVDLSIGKGLSSELKSGEQATFTVSVFSRGPNDAQNVVITDATPANATFVSATQTVGSGFSCTGTSTVTCTGAVMKPGETAVFEFVYTAGAAGQTITNTATVANDTEETNNDDNSATAGPYTISPGGGGGGTCTVACPDDIQTPANTFDDQNNPGAIVHFSPPSGNEECGTITVDHCNDCFFPQGSTVVTATSASTGETCSFTVTVTAAGSSPTIACPGNKTGNADSSCQVTFSLGTATASGQNVTVVAYRSDGKPVYTCDAFGNCTRNGSDAPFSAGTATVTWYAYAHDVPGPYTGPVDGNGDPVNPADTEEAHRTGSATCVQTVTVNDVTPPTITATDQTVAADANCQAAVPDYSNSASDNCSCASSDTSEICNDRQDIIVTQDIPAGTLLGPGSYQIHLSANDGSSNNNGAGNTTNKTITFTVADQTPPAIICPANITTNTAPGTCSATVNPGTATASDNCDTTPTIVGTRSDNQPLNATYPKGTTTIHWTATDDAGNSSSCDQTVTVEDHEPPTISCPANMTLEPTCPSGAIATYTAPVGQDNCPGANTTRTAGGASGSVFPIGTTTVTYTVTDASGNTASCSFTVTVKTVLQTLDDLRASVAANQQLNGSQKNGLISKLDAAKQHIQNGNQNGACSKLADFVNSTQNFISHGDLSAATGNAWISTANHIRNAIGCTNNPCS